MMRRLSLRGRLFVLLISPLFLVSVAASYARYQSAVHLSRGLYDNTLLAVALTISRDVVISEGDMLTEKLLDELTQALGDPVYYRITGPDGRFVTGYSDPPDLPPDTQIEGGEPVFFNSVSLGQDVRAVLLREFISDPEFGGWVTVEVWQTTTQRFALSRQLLSHSLMLLASVLLTAVLILWFGIKLGLKPLTDLHEAIGQRSPDDLRLIRRWVPPELRPLVRTTNSLFERLSRAFALRDGFISDAAHQMRNPVAAMQSQAEAALSAPTEADLRDRVASIAQSARATSRLTSQLLSLERVRGRSLKEFVQSIDLEILIRNQMRSFAEAQLRRDIDVTFTVTGTARPVECDPVLVSEMVTNLLDNAVKYGLQPGGQLEVTMIFTPDTVTLRFADDGPGIPEVMRARVFDRFFRLDADQSAGCGLGLAIVHDVAVAHDGAAHCTGDGPGAVFEVLLRR